MQGGGGIDTLTEAIYADPSILNIVKMATGPVGNGVVSFETPHKSDGTDVVHWSPAVSDIVQKNMKNLESAQNFGDRARSDEPGWMGAIPDYVPGGGTKRFDASSDPFGHHEREARARAARSNQPYNAGVYLPPDES